MGEPDDRRATRSSLDHLRSLGVEVEPLAGERCARGTLRLTGGPLVAPHGSLDTRVVRFATVGAGAIKCLEPAPLFHLPLIPIHGCASAAEIEGRVRAAWTKHAQALHTARELLERIGFSPRASAGGMLLEVAIGLDGESIPVRLHDVRRALLPTAGPLAGRRVDAPEDRLARIDVTASSVTEVEIALTTRMEEIARRVDRARDAERRLASERAPSAPAAPRSAGARRILVVGPILGRDKALLDALRRWGYRLRLEYSANDALAAFRDHTFDLVLADAHLGRSEAIELVPEVNALPGIERLPVVIVDERSRPALRAAAKQVGAAGYLVHPIAPERIADGLRRMADGDRGRRYSRLLQRLSVAWGSGASGYTNTIGRLGMFVTLGDAPEPAEGGRCEVLIPELGRTLRVETQLAYRIDSAGARDAGLGLRIRAFPDRNEAIWIDYLSSLLRSTPPDES